MRSNRYALHGFHVLHRFQTALHCIGFLIPRIAFAGFRNKLSFLRMFTFFLRPRSTEGTETLLQIEGSGKIERRLGCIV